MSGTFIPVKILQKFIKSFSILSSIVLVSRMQVCPEGVH